MRFKRRCWRVGPIEVEIDVRVEFLSAQVFMRSAPRIRDRTAPCPIVRDATISERNSGDRINSSKRTKPGA